jgi:hypothetical protein
MTLPSPSAATNTKPIWFLCGLGGLLAARTALLWPTGHLWWAYVGFTFLLNFWMI